MIVASDLEGTLTTGRTWKGVGMWLKANGLTWPYQLFFLPRLPGSFIARIGVINKVDFGNSWIVDEVRLFKGFDQAHIDSMGACVVDQVMWPQRRQAVVAELQRLRDEGYRTILTSGTYTPIAQAFARRAGFSDAIGTPLEMAAGVSTGKCDGPLNNKDIKAERLRSYLGNEPLDVAYGDTAADIPMMRMARTAVAVYPDRDLRQAAQQNGWRVLES
ncbi:MAG TPA: HAD-IB family phosphatase [Anaerolineae bacterium]|jgi:phosphoserine phosphatase